MNYQEFLTRIIDDGIEAAKEDYDGHEDANKLAGAIRGFEVCRDKLPTELLALLTDANAEIQRRYGGDLAAYWRQVCYAAEIEWVCKCVSALLVNQGERPIVPVTAGGVMKAAEVLGVRKEQV